MTLGEPAQKTITVRLFGGEQDGLTFDMPAHWTPNDPPLHHWVITALGERQLREYGDHEPAGLRAQLTTCAYKHFETLHDDGEPYELHYTRDVANDVVHESTSG